MNDSANMSRDPARADAPNSLVSVVMATYSGDRSDHLRLAIDSLLHQQYPALEFLLVVDGPVADERRAYLDDLSRDARVRVIYQPENQGPSATRNIGILASRGDYIAIMDADDISLPHRISSQLEYLEKHQLDVMSNFVDIIDDEGRECGSRTLPTDVDGVRRLAPFQCPLHNPAAFGRAALFKSFQYDPTLSVSEDYELWVRLLKAGFRLGNSTDHCVLYRQAPYSTARRRGLRYALSDLRVKCSAVGLAPWYLRPVVPLFALATAAVRLLPAPLFRFLYSFRR